MGGKETGCSFVGKLKDEYWIDLDFWFNKKVSYSRTSTVKSAAYEADRLLATGYYEEMVMKNIPSKEWYDLISRGWCRYNLTSGTGEGRYEYSCEAEPELKMFERNDNSVVTFKKEFSDYYKNAERLMQSAYADHHIINRTTLDIAATLADDYLFNDAAITRFRYLYSKARPFTTMCDGGLSSYTSESFKFVNKPNYYPIALTADPSAFTAFQSMTPLGGTDSVNGLLRAVPVAAKGKNPRKVIILLTDGEDTGTISSGPLLLRNKLVQDYNLCGVIKSGLLKYPKGTPTTSVDMY